MAFCIAECLRYFSGLNVGKGGSGESGGAAEPIVEYERMVESDGRGVRN